MNFITGKHLSRRTFLRGTGASVALPLMDAMVPAGRAWRDPAAQFTRFIGVEESMGCAGGSDWGDAQYLFAEDVLGYTRGHKPRHAKTYRNFRSEFERLQRERIAAFTEYKADVDSGAYPGKEHVVRIDDAEYEKFMTALKR